MENNYQRMFLVDAVKPRIIAIYLSECDYSNPVNYFCNSSVVAGTGTAGTSKINFFIYIFFIRYV